MHLMKGDIGFSSHPDKGSRFWIDIPVYDPANDHDGADSDTGQATGYQTNSVEVGHDWTLLCVDDNPTGLELVTKIVADIHGIRLLTAGTAEAGISLARQHRPNLILMDIHLPGMDGIQALTELRRHAETRDIPVIALSAAASKAEIERGTVAGFMLYLTKPYDVRYLKSVIIEALSAQAGMLHGASVREGQER